MDEAKKLFDSVYTGLQIEEAIAAGLELRNDPQLALVNLGARPNRNLLRNAYFVGGGSQKGNGYFPINQKGQTEYAYPNKSTTIDGWSMWGAASTAQITDAGLIVGKKSEGSNTYVVFEQTSDQNIAEGEELIASVLLDNNELYTVHLAPGWVYSGDASVVTTYYRNESITIRTTADNRICVRLYWGSAIALGNTSLHKAVKLECGAKQTLAYKDADGQWKPSEIPDCGAELARCQRQLYIPATGTASTYYSAVVNPTSGDIFFPVILPVPMRAAPAITVAQATLYVGNEQKTVTPSAVTCYGLRGNQALCRANGVASGVSAKTGIVEIGGLQLSAEL